MIELQTQLIFPTHAVAPAGPLPRGAERLEIEGADGDRLSGIHIPPAARARGERVLILGFAGNAWNAQDVAEYLHEVYPQAHVVAFHYRGYSPSTGRPSAEGLLRDAPLVYDKAVETVDPDKVVAVGFSIGSGVAAALSRQRDPAGLILVTPFDSLKAVASDLYPFLPVGLLFRHELDSASALRGSQVPTAIVAGERDDLVRPARTEALRKAVGNLVFDRTIRGAGHNDIYARSDFQQAMRDALEIMAG